MCQLLLHGEQCSTGRKLRSSALGKFNFSLEETGEKCVGKVQHCEVGMCENKQGGEGVSSFSRVLRRGQSLSRDVTRGGRVPVR